MASFDKYSNYDNDAGVTGVVFGAEVPVLEVELNEMQEIQKTLLGNVLKSLIGNGISDKKAITYLNNTLSISDCFFAVNGYLVHCNGLSISAKSGDSVYLQVWEDTVDHTATLKKAGNEQSTDIVPNYIKDSRIGEETSRRKVVKYTLVTTTDSNKENLPIATISDDGITLLVKEVNLTNLSDRLSEFIIETANTYLPLTGGAIKGDLSVSGDIKGDLIGNAETSTKATSADELNTNAGSATQPTYFSDGIPKVCTYTLEKSVPADAVFTDTKYTDQIGMTTLGFTKNATYTVHEFFTAIYKKGYSGKISLRFRYDSSSTAKISDGTTTIDMSGVDCYLSVYGGVNSTWKKNYALLSVQKKLYLLYCIHDGDATKPSSQGIVDVTTMKAVQDGNGNVITDTYLPLKGGTMDKGASIIVQREEDDRYTKIVGGTIYHYLNSTTGYTGGISWFDHSKNLLGEIGLYGSKGIPEYYFVGNYSDPFIKVDMEGNTTIKKKLTVNNTSYINGLTTLFVQKNDTTGYPSYLLAFDITNWYLNGSSAKNGFNGHVYSDRSGGYMSQEEVATVIMDCGYSKSTTIGSTLRLSTSNGNYRPCMIHDTTNNKYYLALKISGQDRRLVFHGRVCGTMSTTQIKATDGSGTLPTGYEFTFDPANCTIGMGVSSSCSGNSKTAAKNELNYVVAEVTDMVENQKPTAYV